MGYLFAIMVMVGIGVLAYKTISIRREWLGRMSQLAHARGWRLHRSTWGSPSVEGEAFGCRVKVRMPIRVPDRHDRHRGLADTFARSNYDHAWHYTRLEVTLPRSMSLAFSAESGRIGRLLQGRDLELGDPTFDETVRLTGGETVLRAIFDGPARWAVRLLVERGGAFDGDTLDLSWQHDKAAARDTESIDCAFEVLRHLRETKGTTRERLAAIAAEDSKPGVRRGALACLVERHRTAAETEPALRLALEDADAAVRLIAAVQLSDLAILESLVPPGHPMDVRVGAVQALAGHEDGMRTLRGLIARLDGAAKQAAIAALKAQGGVDVGGLALADAQGGELALSDPPAQ